MFIYAAGENPRVDERYPRTRVKLVFSLTLFLKQRFTDGTTTIHGCFGRDRDIPRVDDAFAISQGLAHRAFEAMNGGAEDRPRKNRGTSARPGSG